MARTLLVHDPSPRHVREARDKRGGAAVHWAARANCVESLALLKVGQPPLPSLKVLNELITRRNQAPY